jgi:hypothetical protein
MPEMTEMTEMTRHDCKQADIRLCTPANEKPHLGSQISFFLLPIAPGFSFLDSAKVKSAPQQSCQALQAFPLMNVNRLKFSV